MTYTSYTSDPARFDIPRRRLPPVVAAGSAATVGLAVGPAPAGAEPRGRRDEIANPRFEDGLEGWEVVGDGASAVELDDGTFSLRCAPARGGSVTVSQDLEIRRPRWWTLRASVRAGGSGTAGTLTLRSRRVQEQVHIPVTGPSEDRLEMAVSAQLPAGLLEIELRTEGTKSTDESWTEITDLRLEPVRVQRDVRGADLSGIPKNEAHGAEYFSADGSVSEDPVQVFAEHGATMGRLRVWVDPADGFCTPEHTTAMAQRISQAGMEVLIDFHYSDTWTDPGAQGIPSAWLPDAPAGLADSVAEHTRSTLLAIRDAGVDVAAVQVGNEINPGMLWPWGQTWDVDPDDGVDGARYDDLARFLTAGSLAVTEVFPRAEVMLHLTNIHDGIDGLTSWFDEITQRDVPFDVIGLSYYSYWHGTLIDLQRTISTLADRYERDVIVVETAYAFTLEDDPRSPFENIVADPSQLAPGYPATPEGQAAAFLAVQDVTVSAPATGGRGRGAVYWEPAWTAVDGAGWDPEDPSSGNAWENQAMFDFDGRLLPAPFAAFS